MKYRKLLRNGLLFLVFFLFLTVDVSQLFTPEQNAPFYLTAAAQFEDPFRFTNPLRFSTVDGVLTSLLSFLRSTIVLLALIMIVIGGFLYITSAGDDSRMETAKKCILAALIGLALGIAAPTFLKEIYTILGATGADPTVTAAPSILKIATNLLSFLLTIIGIFTIIMLVVGGIMYLTSAGDEDRIDRGKKLVKYAVIGITIALASLVLVKQLAAFFAA